MKNLFFYLLCSLTASIGLADFLPMIDGTELSATGSLGTERTSFYGFDGDIILGSLINRHSRSGDFHLNYTNDIEPTNPPDTGSPLKSVIYWAGGFSILPWKDGTIGLDYDSSSDSFEQLYSTGIKLTLGQGPISASYRYAETQLLSTDGVYVNPANQNKVKYSGAFIFQQTAEIDGSFHTTKMQTIFGSVAASWYNPDAADFANLLSQTALQSLANFQDALQDFELWSVTLGWRQKWTRALESKVSQSVANLVIATNPYTVSTVTVGYHWTPQYYTSLGYQYSYTPVEDTSNIILELRFDWDRK